MSRVRALVEGQTEEAFVREVLAPDLGAHGVFVNATMSGKPGRRGGVRSWPVVRRDILATLKQDQAIYCTTMFDYYALPSDWPGYAKAKRARTNTSRAKSIEDAILADVQEVLGHSFNPRRLIPYIQMHEFEALLFSDTRVLAEVVQHPRIEAGLNAIVEDCGEPEGIDDNPKTAPSKRISGMVPGFQKVLHGVIAAKRMGLSAICSRCPHFSQWVDALRGLGLEQGGSP